MEILCRRDHLANSKMVLNNTHLVFTQLRVYPKCCSYCNNKIPVKLQYDNCPTSHITGHFHPKSKT
jgi:hypothetical protein